MGVDVDDLLATTGVPGHRLSLPTKPEVLSLLSTLEAYLPYSLPLYRRLQFYLAHPSDPTGPPHAHIFQAFAKGLGGQRSKPRPAGGGGRLLQDEPPDAIETMLQRPWLAAHVDLSRSGETQIWVFANWECPSGKDYPRPQPEDIGTRRCLLLSFFEFVYTHYVPLMPPTTPLSFMKVKKLHGNHHSYSPSAVLLGSCNLSIRSLIPELAIRRVDQAYMKYVFSSAGNEQILSEPIPNTLGTTLPPGYRFGPLRQPKDLQLAIDRTTIPRTVETLAQLPSRAVFFEDEPEPVAWGFLGVDASLTSLHTEPHHRGKNLAVLLARELLRMQGQYFSARGFEGRGDGSVENGSELGHADVGEVNLGSRRVMEKAGARPLWKVCWVEVELETLFGEGGIWRSARRGAIS
ncbi:hypothetical protein GJ744_007925 [Endocarpon pusillum]|uniref:N-acetyltransferase domain-containing protein n=1 Tax=Endocarpon pusillum TaxID=364733 RepID=A0A8H7AQY1_9EURO|nr:hypothetical protein GJ744_007925 [Endocarpon pusillum]